MQGWCAMGCVGAGHMGVVIGSNSLSDGQLHVAVLLRDGAHSFTVWVPSGHAARTQSGADAGTVDALPNVPPARALSLAQLDRVAAVGAAERTLLAVWERWPWLHALVSMMDADVDARGAGAQWTEAALAPGGPPVPATVHRELTQLVVQMASAHLPTTLLADGRPDSDSDRHRAGAWAGPLATRLWGSTEPSSDVPTYTTDPADQLLTRAQYSVRMLGAVRRLVLAAVQSSQHHAEPGLAAMLGDALPTAILTALGPPPPPPPALALAVVATSRGSATATATLTLPSSSSSASARRGKSPALVWVEPGAGEVPQPDDTLTFADADAGADAAPLRVLRGGGLSELLSKAMPFYTDVARLTCTYVVRDGSLRGASSLTRTNATGRARP
jgi:hypothetical protein